MMLKTVKYFNDLSALRFSSTKPSIKKVVKYTKTINLPKTKFPIGLSATKREELEKRIIEGLFADAYKYQERHNEEPTFVLHDGPPYANGDLHMGHAVNKILKDITLRQNVAKGRKVNYIPGWDCHGLPIELKATADSKITDPLAIREKCKKFASDAVFRQKEEFRSWGVFADWSSSENLYLTYNSKFIIGQMQMFNSFFKKKLVYRDLKPVYWSPSSRTALAEAELEYDHNFTSPSVIVRFAIDNVPDQISFRKIYALVWTTTPWTLLSNQAICYNPALEYCIVQLKKQQMRDDSSDHYLLATNLVENFEQMTGLQADIVKKISGNQLNGFTYMHPIIDHQASMPFLPASHVQDTKGTGLVHTAPAHGHDDFLVGLEQKMPILCYVDEKGLYTEEAPLFLRRKHVLNEGNDLVLQHIANDVIFSGKLSHSYPIDWRTNQPVIIRASEQWFMDTENLKNAAIDEINRIDVYPKINAEVSKRALIMQVKKRPYWCISRQRVWGIPIPVFYEKKTGKAVINENIIDHVCNEVEKEGSIDFWWKKSVDQLLSPALLSEIKLSSDDLTKGSDIFDIWFDSGSSWSSVLKEDKIADLYLEGYDQFTGWFQSSLLTSIASRKQAPYKSLFVHGFTIDDKGHKMSKSRGNVISPKDVVKKYGTDVLRWWVASHGTQHAAITVSDHLLQQSAENLNKIRFTLRYLNGVIGERNNNQTNGYQLFLNKFLLNSLFEIHNQIQTSYDSYDYHRVVANLQHFVANELNALYLHLIKDRMYCGSDDELNQIRFTLSNCYEIICKILWPIAPFLVEESWSYYDSMSPFHQQNIKPDARWKDEKVKAVHETVMNIKRQINKEANHTNTWLLSVQIGCSVDRGTINNLMQLQPQLNELISNSELSEILQVSDVTLDTSASEGIVVKVLDCVLCPRCRRFPANSEESVCSRCTDVLKYKENIAI